MWSYQESGARFMTLVKRLIQELKFKMKSKYVIVCVWKESVNTKISRKKKNYISLYVDCVKEP